MTSTMDQLHAEKNEAVELRNNSHCAALNGQSLYGERLGFVVLDLFIFFLYKKFINLLYLFFGFMLPQTGEQCQIPNKQLGFFHRSFSTDKKPQKVCF